MSYDNEQFENYLRTFEPKRPRSLSSAPEARPEWRRLAAAAAVLIALGISLWFGVRKGQPRLAVLLVTRPAHPAQKSPIRPSILQLTRIAVEDPAKLDAELAQQSTEVLPNFRRKESTLRVLAKE
jgi:hypothetical protein